MSGGLLACLYICLERGADLHTAQLMLLPLTVSCFSKIQTGFTFLVPGHPGSPGKRAVKHACVLHGNKTDGEVNRCFSGAGIIIIFIIPVIIPVVRFLLLDHTPSMVIGRRSGTRRARIPHWLLLLICRHLSNSTRCRLPRLGWRRRWRYRRLFKRRDLYTAQTGGFS